MLKLFAAVRRLLPLLVVVALAAVCFFIWKKAAEAGRFEEKKTLALTILRSEEMNFLVTRKLFSTVVLEKRENSVLWGERFGLLAADVELYYGFDLNKLDPASVRNDGGKILVKLPEAELLNVSVDLASMKYYTKQSSLAWLADKFGGRDIREELRREFSQSAKEHFAAKGLIPTRRELLESLRKWAKPRLEAEGAAVEFE